MPRREPRKTVRYDPENTASAGVGFTVREDEVFALVVKGETNPEIAALLNASGRTIEKHIGSILRKLDAADRVKAICGYFGKVISDYKKINAQQAAIIADQRAELKELKSQLRRLE